MQLILRAEQVKESIDQCICTPYIQGTCMYIILLVRASVLSYPVPLSIRIMDRILPSQVILGSFFFRRCQEISFLFFSFFFKSSGSPAIGVEFLKQTRPVVDW